MGRRGNPYDAQAASSFKTVKCEEVYLKDFQTFQDIVDHLPQFLYQVYDENRLHWALGYLSPMDFKAQHAQQAAQIQSPCCPNTGGHTNRWLLSVGIRISGNGTGGEGCAR